MRGGCLRFGLPDIAPSRTGLCASIGASPERVGQFCLHSSAVCHNIRGHACAESKTKNPYHLVSSSDWDAASRIPPCVLNFIQAVRKHRQRGFCSPTGHSSMTRGRACPRNCSRTGAQLPSCHCIGSRSEDSLLPALVRCSLPVEHTMVAVAV